MLKRREQSRDSAKAVPGTSPVLSIDTRVMSGESAHDPSIPSSSTILISTDESTLDGGESVPSSPVKKTLNWPNLLRREKPIPPKTPRKPILSWHGSTTSDPTTGFHPPLEEQDQNSTGPKSIFRRRWPHIHLRTHTRCNSFSSRSGNELPLVVPPEPPMPINAQCIDWPPRQMCSSRWEDWLHKNGAEDDQGDGSRSDPELDLHPSADSPQDSASDHSEAEEHKPKVYYRAADHDSVGLASLYTREPRRRSSCPSLNMLCNKEPEFTKQAAQDSPRTNCILRQNQSKKKKHLSLHCDSPAFSGSAPPQEDKRLALPNVTHPATNKPIVRFSAMKPRTVPLRRRTGSKHELKALHVWRAHVQTLLTKEIERPPSPAKVRANPSQSELARKFIMRELYTTEVTFWNQLYYSKVMFRDPILSAYQRGSPFIHLSDLDLFANLNDLFQFSSRLIQRLNHFQFDRVITTDMPIEIKPEDDPLCTQCPSQVWLGQALNDLSEDMVVFLRCALDYKTNRKRYELSHHNKAYSSYKEKLMARKETRQFTMADYLIIPIQRVARYGLLLTDLLKHTDPNNPDYANLVNAKVAIAGLATAMNYAQK